MITKLRLSCKPLGLNNPKTYVLTLSRFNTYMISIFGDLNEAQIYKVSYRDSPHHELDKVLFLNNLYIFKSNEDKNFLNEIGERNFVYVVESLVSSETGDRKVENFSKQVFNNVKYKYAYSRENIYFMLHRKRVPIEEYKNSTQKDVYEYLYGKDDELKGNKITDETQGNIE